MVQGGGPREPVLPGAWGVVVHDLDHGVVEVERLSLEAFAQEDVKHTS